MGSVYVWACHGLKVCTPPPESSVEAPTPSAMVLEGGVFERCLDLDEVLTVSLL